MTELTSGGYLPRSDEFEVFLSRFNHALRGEFWPPEPTQRSFATVQITGLPRSGTTILYQLLARSRCVGYPSNVMALCWQVPSVGARLQRHLATSGSSVSLTSVAGRAPEPLDPHEFGYFWRAALGHSANTLEQDIEPWPTSELQALLDEVTGIFNAPVVYKNFLVLSHAAELRRDLAGLRFVVTERRDLDSAASLVSMRRRLNVQPGQWIGVRPHIDRDMTKASDIEHVAWQIASLRAVQCASTLDHASDSRVVLYDHLCADPRGVIGELLDFIGADVDSFDPNLVPRRLEPGAGAAGLSAQDRKILTRALSETMEMAQ